MRKKIGFGVNLFSLEVSIFSVFVSIVLNIVSNVSIAVTYLIWFYKIQFDWILFEFIPPDSCE